MLKTSNGELLLREILQLNIDNSNVIYNYRGLGIKNDKTNNSLEVDIYYPDYKLAFEFQGEEHYNVTSFADNEMVKEIKRRDLIKLEFCKEHGITLIAVNALKLGVRCGRHMKLPDIKITPYNRNDSCFISKVKLIEWKCKEYRKHLNKSYDGHTSARTSAKLWRDKMKKQGVEIPERLRRKTDISIDVQRSVENGTYSDSMVWSRKPWPIVPTAI